MSCRSCFSTSVTRWRIIIANGTSQIRDICDKCGKNANGKGINLPHNLVNDIESLPIYADYRADQYAQTCTVCGEPGIELHHIAPREIFGDECELWPTIYFCLMHHIEWHQRIREYYAERQPAL